MSAMVSGASSFTTPVDLSRGARWSIRVMDRGTSEGNADAVYDVH